MLFQILLNFIAALIKFAVWVSVVLAAIPYGIYVFLSKNFHDFTMDGGFGFWAVFSFLTILGFVILWKPILWVVGTLRVLGAGME